MSSNIPNNFLICDHTDSVALIKRLIQEAKAQFSANSIEPPKPKFVSETISKCKAKGISPEQFRHTAETNNNEMNVIISDIFVDYQAQLAKDHALDFDDLLSRGLELFKEHQRVLANVKHVLVDEFQDTNTVQYDMVKQMARKSQALTIVGDPDQVSSPYSSLRSADSFAEYLWLAIGRSREPRLYAARLQALRSNLPRRELP